MMNKISNLRTTETEIPQKTTKSKTTEPNGFAGQLGQVLQAGQLVETASTSVKAEQGLQGQSKETEDKKAPKAMEISGQMMAVMPHSQLNAQDGTRGTSEFQKSGQSFGLNASTAELLPLTQKIAVSSNTATAITGLKPWSKEWVFEGKVDPAKAQVKPLFSSDSPEGGAAQKLQAGIPTAQLTKTAEGLMDDAIQAESAGSVELPKGFSVARQDLALDRLGDSAASILPNTRGDAGLADLSRSASAADLVGLSQLQEMNGTVEGVSKSPAPSPLSGGLSGGEFLNTLNVVQGAKQEFGKDDSGQEGGKRESSGSRPELRVLEGGRKNQTLKEVPGFGEALGVSAGVQGASSERPTPPTVELTAQVAKGAMSQDRLSSDALLGMSTGIKNLSTQGGGEIRVRLKPENLGELHLRVITRGNDVGIHIQASDERAKKVLEESMSFLKESLASQNLSLGRVDLTVAQAFGNTGDMKNDQGQQHAQQGFSDMRDMMGQNAGQSGQQRDGGLSGGRREAEAFGSIEGRVRAPAASGSFAAQRSRQAAINGRLDVTA